MRARDNASDRFASRPQRAIIIIDSSLRRSNAALTIDRTIDQSLEIFDVIGTLLIVASLGLLSRERSGVDLTYDSIRSHIDQILINFINPFVSVGRLLMIDDESS
jgi:hypothetical protein